MSSEAVASVLRQWPAFKGAVALVEPRIPQNTGNIARLCASVGCPLFLLGELGFELGDKFLARAGMDYLEMVEPIHYPDPSVFFQEHADYQPYFFTTKAHQVLWDVTVQSPALLVFGREDKGLPEPLLAAYPERLVGIPMVAGPRSLNLSSAAAAAVYDVWRQQNQV